MQYLVIALVYSAFLALVLAAKKHSRGFTIAFLITAFLAVLALAVWGVLRNF